MNPLKATFESFQTKLTDLVESFATILPNTKNVEGRDRLVCEAKKEFKFLRNI